MSRLPLSLVLVCGWGVGCESEQAPSGGAGGGTSRQSSSATSDVSSSARVTTGEPTPTAFVSVSAPDRSSFVLNFEGELNGIPSDLEGYEIVSDHGSLAVVGLSADAALRKVTLFTDKQKLGVTYTVRIRSGGPPLQGSAQSCLSADQATLWATDFSEPDFPDYEVQAERVAVGKYAVMYLEVGEPKDQEEIDLAVELFDELIYPKMTSMLHPAPDRDGNGRILLLGLNGGDYYGGYFSQVNAFTEEKAQMFGYHSNEMDMLYINSLAGWQPQAVITHEFSHLLYHEQHSDPSPYAYHNEGLAECAVHLVHGVNEIARDYYLSGAQGQLTGGKSLVQWDYGNYAQYAQAYMFWTYVASRLGGPADYGALFDVPSHPAVVDDFLRDKLGDGFSKIELEWLAASWARAPSGKYGYGTMLSLPSRPQALPAGTGPVQLAPFAGVYFAQTNPGVTPIGAGPDLLFLGVGNDTSVDDLAPFDVPSGVVVALNGELDVQSVAPQTTGDVGTSLDPVPVVQSNLASTLGRHWLKRHPPPVHPANRAALHAWRRATQGN